MSHDAIVLAGGTGRRMGGVLKPQVTVRGRRLLDHVLDATTGAGRVVVVAPEAVPVPDGVLRTLEDPPHGGPVAGIAAGLAALGEEVAPVVLVLACDLPGAAAAAPRLLAAAGTPPPAGAGQGGARDEGATPGSGPVGCDGVVLRDGEGRQQWLLGVYASRALRARVETLTADGRLRGASVRELVRPLVLVAVEARAGEAQDVDTWADRDAMSP